MTFGNDILRQRGSDAVELMSVELQRPRNLRLVEAQLVPLTGDSYLGTRDHYPPRTNELEQDGLAEDWAQRVAGAGGTLKAVAADSSTPLNLVMGVTVDEGVTGRAESISITYRSGGEEYVTSVPTTLFLTSDRAGCAAVVEADEGGPAT